MERIADCQRCVFCIVRTSAHAVWLQIEVHANLTLLLSTIGNIVLTLLRVGIAAIGAGRRNPERKNPWSDTQQGFSRP